MARAADLMKYNTLLGLGLTRRELAAGAPSERFHVVLRVLGIFFIYFYVQ